jgi:SAM-dependent methyltransferase
MEGLVSIILLGLVVLGVAMLVRNNFGDRRTSRRRQGSGGRANTLSDNKERESAPPTPEAPVGGTTAIPASSTVKGTTILIGDAELKRGYEQLRGRDELLLVKTVWSAGYQSEMAYFDQERRYLEQHPDVHIERIVSANSPQVRHLHKLASEHPGRYKLYNPASTEISFEVYVCEYGSTSGRPSSSSGILTVVNPDGRQPEFGFLVDGYVNGELTQFARAFQVWFESIKGPPLGDLDSRQNVWDTNADIFDSYISRNSDVPFLRDFIRAEDAYLAQLIERDRTESDIVFLEFGSGTGRTIDYLCALPNVSSRVSCFIGLDPSERMATRARTKRDRRPRPGHEKTFYFTVDGCMAARNFGNGRVHLTSELGDYEHVEKFPLDYDAYQESKRLICCLLNTAGIVRGDSREQMMANMFACAQDGDMVVISAFDGGAFEHQALGLYEEIQPVVGASVVPGAFSSDTRTFTTGNYYSQWCTESEMRDLIVRAGGIVIDVREIEGESGQESGRIFICERGASRLASGNSHSRSVRS